MITTVHSLAVQLARDLGISTFDTTENTANRVKRAITLADKNAILIAINGAYGEAFKEGPAAISESDVGSVLRAPTTITLSATQYSATISSVVTYASWMKGCTIRIAGDSYDNELVDGTTLSRPFTGATGSGITATVYADCIPLTGVLAVMPPIRIHGKGRMQIVDTREEFAMWCNQTSLGGASSGAQTNYGSYNADTNKYTADPTVAFVDSRYAGASAALQKFIRFNTLPSAVLSVLYRVKLTPPVFTETDIGDFLDTDPGTVLPLDNLSNVIYAIARQRITGDPLFGALDAKAEIARQYKHAIGMLGASQPSSAPRRGHYS